MALACAGGGVLTGCSAASLPLISVHNGADGTPQLTLVPCGKDKIGSVDLDAAPEVPAVPVASATVSPGSPTVPAPREGWSAYGSPLADGEVTFPLFSPPAEWKARQSGGAQSVRPGYTYSASFHAPGFSDYSGVAHFTAEDLAGLKSGEVWANGKAMSPKKFRKLVKDKC
ncbi:hypothetical protein [Streptomyces sp. NPDC059874]|uniref:hypothetical protein n=1 Tax=Streptomyces sp. NPDC059874 TaxID=3346983 RepID=UPI003669FE17